MQPKPAGKNFIKNNDPKQPLKNYQYFKELLFFIYNTKIIKKV